MGMGQTPTTSNFGDDAMLAWKKIIGEHFLLGMKPIIMWSILQFWSRRLARGEMPGVGAQHRPDVEAKSLDPTVLPGNLPRNLRFLHGKSPGKAKMLAMRDQEFCC